MVRRGIHNGTHSMSEWQSVMDASYFDPWSSRNMNRWDLRTETSQPGGPTATPATQSDDEIGVLSSAERP